MTARPNLLPKVGYGVAVASDGTLSAPNIAPQKLFVTIPRDGSNFGAQMNAAIASAASSRCGEVVMNPGWFTAEVPVNHPGRMNIRGLGIREPNAAGNGPQVYGGGVLITAPYNSATGCLTAIGTNPAPYNTANGFVFYPRFENISCSGATPLSRAQAAGGPPKLIKLVNCYGFELDGISGHNDYHQALYIENCWEFHVEKFRANACGFSEEAKLASASDVIAYTNRQPLALETACGRSLGVPSVEIFSPNTSGADTSNNGRMLNCHLEGNYVNGVGLMIRGGNANNIKLDGWHFELADGDVPLAVVQGISGFSFVNSFVHGFGRTSNSHTNPGLIYIGDAVGPHIGAIVFGYAPGGAPLQAMVHCIGTENPYIQSTMVGGGDALTTAALLFDNCRNVSASRNSCYNWSAAPALASGVVEKSLINGSTSVA